MVTNGKNSRNMSELNNIQSFYIITGLKEQFQNLMDYS